MASLLANPVRKNDLCFNKKPLASTCLVLS